MIINKGLLKNHESNAVDLFLNALGDKFYPILGKRKARQLLELSIYHENCFFAESDSELLGILAFQVNEMNFINPSFKKIISVYGILGGVLKAIALSMLGYKSKDNEIYIEAIVVSKFARGQGIGTKLLDAIFQFAREKEYKTVSLQVIDTNSKAKELYERLGFRVVKRIKTWPINKIIGWSFREVFLMKKNIGFE